MKPTIFILIFTLCLTGCLDFGDDIKLSGSDIDDKVISDISRLTDVVFPEGIIGIEYIYYGSGIDDALILKASIPYDKREEFCENDFFKNGKDESHYGSYLAHNEAWYKVDELKNSEYRGYMFPNGNLIDCHIGEESGLIVIYFSWITV